MKLIKTLFLIHKMNALIIQRSTMNIALSKISLEIGQENYCFVQETGNTDVIILWSECYKSNKDKCKYYTYDSNAFDNILYKDLFELLEQFD